MKKKEAGGKKARGGGSDGATGKEPCQGGSSCGKKEEKRSHCIGHLKQGQLLKRTGTSKEED